MLALLAGSVRLTAADAAEDKEASREALKALQEFIGDWKGIGGPDKVKPDVRDKAWQEKLAWGWRFKGDDAWLTLAVTDGKIFKTAELRYLPAKKKYQLTATDKDGKKLEFLGEVKNDTLKLERVDADTKETQQITMNTAAEGVRFIYRVAHKPAGSTIFHKDFLVQATREGESLGSKEKENKNECVVSGGAGTSTVSYKGETFWVCCSGCREAFNENPEKYIAEFKAKKAKK
jgi:hypothetical protein